MKSYLLTGLLLLGLLVPLVSGCSNDAGAEDEATPNRRTTRVETLKLTPTEFTDVIELTGTVDAVNDATLSAQTAGTLLRLKSLGSRVSQGEVVAQLNPNTASAQVEQAQAQLESTRAQFALAEDNYNRLQPLYQDSIISATEFENTRAQYNQARAQVSQAQAALSQAQEQLENTRIRAPFSGTVEEHFVEVGEQLSPGVRVVRVVDTNPVQVKAGVPERYAGDIERGTPVQIDFRAYSGAQRTGNVTFVGSAIDPQSRTFSIEVELDNPEGRLKPEMVAQLYVTRQQLSDVLVVPRPAVVRDENDTYVYVVEHTDSLLTAQRRPVTLGASYGDQVVISSGLQTGEEVIVAGQNNVARGDALQVVQQYESARAAGSSNKNEAASESAD